jgi:Undecaprenyl-phosphate galactose phosphotransferase WbaP
VASFFGLLILAPFLGLMAVLIKIDSLGGVFFRQPRLGKDGRVFVPLKFRTMHSDADRILQEKLALDPELKKEWDRYQKLKNDPRITRMGRFLRKFSLDELPQLWNVLLGEMSLVGPRPMLVNQREIYGELFESYKQVTPGITGLWQVSGRNYTTFARRAELDDEYIQRWSLWLDIYILLKTVKVVFTREGAQ